MKRRLRSAVAALLATLMLAGCGESEPPSEPVPPPSEVPAGPPEWQDWVDFDFTAALLTANDAFAAVANTADESTPVYVYNAAGEKQWEVEDYRQLNSTDYAVFSTQESLIVQQQNGDIAAFNWADGTPAWSFSVQELDCIPATGVIPLAASVSAPQLGPGDPLILFFPPALATEMPRSYTGQPPAACANPDAPIQNIVAIDPQTGEELWRGGRATTDDTVESYTINPTGSHLLQVLNYEGQYTLTRTDTHSGKIDFAPLGEAFDFTYYDPAGTEYTLTPEQFAPNDFTIAGDYAGVEVWNDPSTPAVLMPFPDALIDYRVRRSPQTGYIYGLEISTEDFFSDDLYYYLSSLTEPGAGELAEFSADNILTVPAPEISAETWERTELWAGLDPIIPRDGAGPLIAVSNADGDLTAIDYSTGKAKWTSESTGSAAGFARYVPTLDQVVYIRGKEFIAVDAATGEEQWRTPFDGPPAQVEGFGNFSLITVETSAGEVTRMRAIG